MPKLRRTRSALTLTLLVLICGLLVSVGAGIGLRAAEGRNADEVMDQRAAAAREAVAAEAQRYVDAAQSVAAATGAQDELTAAEFAAITAPLVRMRLAGATGVGYVVPAADGEVAAVQRRWRGLGATDLTLRPAGHGREHAFAVLYRTLDGGPAASLGVDISQLPEPANALAASRSGWIVAVSDTYVLLRDRDLPAHRRPLAFVLAAPVYAVAPDGEGQGAFRGWVTMALRGPEFVARTLAQVSAGQLDASMLAVASDGRRVQVAEFDGQGQPSDLRREAVIRVAQQSWLLRTASARTVLPGGVTFLDEGAFAALVGLTLLLAALVYALGSGQLRAEQRVVEATVALRAEQDYIGDLVDTMDVILVACDESGRFTLVNRQAQELHGFPARASGAGRGGPGADGPADDEWARTALTHFYATDGVTPLPADQLPLQRAMADGEVHDVEFIVAPPGLPRRWLTAHGRRMYAADGTPLGAVTAAHDITRLRESEYAVRRAHADLAAANADLERSNEELSAFAGLVSHDLKSPLAGVAGYLDLMRGMYEDGSLPADVRPLLDRMGLGVQRMRTLIDDLLAYATARNAAPDVAAVDLQALVDDVVAVHTDRLRVRGRPDQLFPDVYVAPLPSVAADPAMVRQLLDNLIGNALKYVPPGRAARVDVTAEADEPGWARIVVADRGIGIPPRQHEAIFDSFHRAHRGGAYPGTGLGLAICHRIVTRHGGRIGARDNPGGGAQLWFTLPVAGRPTRPATPPPAILELSGATRPYVE